MTTRACGPEDGKSPDCESACERHHEACGWCVRCLAWQRACVWMAVGAAIIAMAEAIRARQPRTLEGWVAVTDPDTGEVLHRLKDVTACNPMAPQPGVAVTHVPGTMLPWPWKY